MSKDELINEARNFQRYYTKYKTLHDKLNSTSVSERDDSDIDYVWKMHQRLSEMKDQIWRDWGKLEDSDKA